MKLSLPRLRLHVAATFADRDSERQVEKQGRIGKGREKVVVVVPWGGLKRCDQCRVARHSEYHTKC